MAPFIVFGDVATKRSFENRSLIHLRNLNAWTCDKVISCTCTKLEIEGFPSCVLAPLQFWHGTVDVDLASSQCRSTNVGASSLSVCPSCSCSVLTALSSDKTSADAFS